MADVITYDIDKCVVEIGGKVIVGLDRVEVRPLGQEWHAEKDADGEAGWRHEPDPRSELILTIGEHCPQEIRQHIRNLVGKLTYFHVEDSSGTQDAVTGLYARIVQHPPLTRGNEKVTYEVRMQSPRTFWGQDASTVSQPPGMDQNPTA